jgi:hypothetical protein
MPRYPAASASIYAKKLNQHNCFVQCGGFVADFFAQQKTWAWQRRRKSVMLHLLSALRMTYPWAAAAGGTHPSLN